MSLKSFRFALVGCLILATTASAATVTMTSTPAVVRTQVQGGGTYNVLDFFWTNSDGAEFTNYTVSGTAAVGNFHDPARLQDDRQINPAAAGQDGNTAGAVDMWANTVWSSAGKADLGLVSTILADPGGYAPTGSGASPAFTNFKWDVFDNEQGDDNDLSNDAVNPTPAGAEYHIMRVLTSLNARGVIEFLAYDTSRPGNAFPFAFEFGSVPNTPPTVDPEPAAPPVDTTVNPLVTTTFTASDDTPNPPITFSNAVLSSFVPLIPGATNPAFSGVVDAAGNFSWNTNGFARGTYTIDVTATENLAGPGNSGTGGGFVVNIFNVPEPSTLALLGLAMVGALGFRRRNG